MPGETSVGPNLALTLPSPRHLVSPHPLPSPRPLPSERSHRATPFLKLPPLQELAETGESGGEISRDGPGGETPRSRLEGLPPSHSYSLLRHYDDLLSSERSILALPGLLPEIKLSIRTGMARNTARSRFTTLSLEKIDQQGKQLFTEGISSSSRRPEPSFFIHSRDVIGANMPETVKLARGRSKIAFGLRQSGTGSSTSRSLQELFTTPRPGNTFGLEATDGLTALSKASHRGRGRRQDGTMPPATPQESMFDLIRRESRPKASDVQGWPPTPRPHLVPDNTPRTGLGDMKREPSTILIPKLDSPSSSQGPSLATVSERSKETASIPGAPPPSQSPRDRERKDERCCRSSLSVVSLGDALSMEPEHHKPPIRALHHSFDFRPAREKARSREKEKGRGSRHEPTVTLLELPFSGLLDQRTVTLSRKPGQLRDDISLRNRRGGHPRNRLRTKWDSQLTVADSGFHETETLDCRESAASDHALSGWDRELKVKAIRAREGSAVSSTVLALTNPPPSVAATSLAEEETRTVGPLSSHPAMFTVPEERSAPTTSRLVQNTATSHLLSDSDKISNSSGPHLAVPQAGDLKQEGRPPFPGGDTAGSESARTIAIQTSPPHSQKTFARSVRVKTLELFPSATAPLRTPSISVVSDAEDREEEREPASGSKASDDEERSPDRKQSAGSMSIRSKTIKFISPLQTQDNAKRQ